MRSDAGSRLHRQDNQTFDFELYSPSRFGNMGRPIYKPEYWDKVQELDMWTNKYDPVMTCQPLGVPREGPPRRIYQSDKDVTFIYYGRRRGWRIRRVSHHPDRWPPAWQKGGVGYHVFGVYGGTLGRRHAGARRHRVHRWHLVWARRLLPLRSDACGGAIHAPRRRTSVRRHGGRSGGADGAVGVADTDGARNANPDAGLIRERGNCEVYETRSISSQIRH